MNPYSRLANAIIIQAFKDYKTILKKWRRYPGNAKINQTKTEVEEFFHSEWFSMLTKLDGKTIMVRIQEIVLGEAVAV